MVGTPPITIRRSPKSICSWWPGGVSKRTVARASAASSRRSGATARSTVRRLTAIPSRPTAPGAPRRRCRACRRNRSASHASSPASARGPAATPVANVAALGHVAAHRHVAAPELARDPLDPPTQRLQPQHRRDLVRRPHLISPRDLRPRDNVVSRSTPSRPPRFLNEGPVPHVVRGPVLHVARPKRSPCVSLMRFSISPRAQ